MNNMETIISADGQRPVIDSAPFVDAAGRPCKLIKQVKSKRKEAEWLFDVANDCGLPSLNALLKACGDGYLRISDIVHWQFSALAGCANPEVSVEPRLRCGSTTVDYVIYGPHDGERAAILIETVN